MLTELLLKNIKRVRTDKGFTQAEVAARAGLSLSYYNKVESLGSNLTLETIESIARALGVHESEMFSGIATGPQVKKAIKEAIKLLEGLV
jgi:transcriptional regulator with XRE-family HTH domain